MRLIDADALKREMQRLAWNLEDTAENMGEGLLRKRLNTISEGVQRGIDMLNEQPTIEERKTGKWEVTGERKFVALDGSAEKQYRELGYPHHNVLNMRCSNCNKTTMVDASIAYGYCPHCGAKMGEEKEDE